MHDRERLIQQVEQEAGRVKEVVNQYRALAF